MRRKVISIADLAVLPDMRVLALYENGVFVYCQKITLAKMDLAWITNGEDGIE